MRILDLFWFDYNSLLKKPWLKIVPSMATKTNCASGRALQVTRYAKANAKASQFFLLVLTVPWHLLLMGGVLVKRYSLVPARSTFTDAGKALPPTVDYYFLLLVIFFFVFYFFACQRDRVEWLPDCPVLPSACVCALFYWSSYLFLINRSSTSESDN